MVERSVGARNFFVKSNSLLQTPDAATVGSAGGQPLEGGSKYRNQEALKKADTDKSLWF